MYCLKNKILFLLLLILCIVLVGCKKEKYEINIITIEDIYMQEEDEYYVYFYKEDCPYCEDVFEYVNEYLNNPKELKLYVCDLTEDETIKRDYDGEGGQGSNKNYYVDGVTKYEDLYIAGVPSLIKIDPNDISYYVTSGRKKITEYFTNLNNLEDNEDNNEINE